jgi:signal transduction histidine kinase
MVDKISATAWLPLQEPADCAVCARAREALSPGCLATAAGDLALSLLPRGQAVPLLEAAVARLAAAFSTGRVSVLVPAPAGFWRVFTSSSGSETHDLLIDPVRYPELSEVKKTSIPYLAPDVACAVELRSAKQFLDAAGVRGLAAFPVFMPTPGGEPVILKLSLPHVLGLDELALATLAAHLLVHRLSRMPRQEVATQLGLPPPPSSATDPSALLRLLPVPAMVIDGEGRVVHANSRATWLLGGRDAPRSPEPPVLELRPEHPWEVHGSRWEAQVASNKGEMHVLGWSSKVAAGRLLVLLEPHPEARRRSFERRIRRTLAEKLRELEAANALLEEHARSRARFVSDAAHELKTPLAILRSYLDTLTDDLAEGLTAQQRDFLQAATHGARRLQRLIDELLDLAALESGHISLSLGPVPGRHVVNVVIDELQPLADGARVVLRGSGDDEVTVRGDRERLAQVLRNLVENGLKYTRAGGEVAVLVERGADHATFSVRDNGVGIPAEELPRIFEEFVRIPAQQSVEGAGLGLAIVRRLVLAMGGRVWAESTSGSGSTFFVELPLWTGQG